MGVLIDGKWTDGELPQETGETGQFKRADSVFRGRITADGSSDLLKAARERNCSVLTKPVKPAALRAYLAAQRSARARTASQ